METKVKQSQTRKTTGRKKSSPDHPKTAKSQEKPILKIQNLDMDAIIPDPNQPRKTFDENSLKALSESIAQHGV